MASFRIPKLEFNTEALVTARRKLQTKGPVENFTTAEREALLALIRKSEKVFYPSRLEMDLYRANMHDISRLDPEAYPYCIAGKIRQVQEFEIKYCRKQHGKTA